MKLIAHRGNTNGPNPETENCPQQIKNCIDQGYDVEIDLHMILQPMMDTTNHSTRWYFCRKLTQFRSTVKTLTTLHEFSDRTSGYNYQDLAR